MKQFCKFGPIGGIAVELILIPGKLAANAEPADFRIDTILMCLWLVLLAYGWVPWALISGRESHKSSKR